jgi:hypothetical protein
MTVNDKDLTLQEGTRPEGSNQDSTQAVSGGTNVGGGKFDPKRWKTPVDARLDPNRKTKPVTFSKIDVRKPPADHYVRVHPNPEFNGVFPLYSDSEAKRYDPYLIAPELIDLLPPQVKVNVKYVRLAVGITDMGHPFLWYVAQSGSGFHESGEEAILVTMTRWAKVIPDTNAYRLEYPQIELPDPVFPDWPFEEYIARRFSKDRYIEDLSHPVIKRLAGIR